jgi:hypothetical protein
MTDIAPISKPWPRVRAAVREDIPEIFNLGRLLFKENAIMDWSDERIARWVEMAIQGDRAVIGVIGEVGRLEGMIHLFVSNFWYTDESHLEELYNFVHPDYRKSNNAKALLEFAKNAAKGVETSKGVGVPLMVGIISNHRTEQKIKLYQRRLGKPSGAYWLFNAKTGK